MKSEHLKYLHCPECKNDLVISRIDEEDEKIKRGALKCNNCHASYEIENYIPRFIRSNYYADSFGPQWKTFARSQIDTPELQESKIRFDTEIGWGKEIEGKSIIELGSGAGRFIDVVSRYDASVAIGVDVTDAVDASQETMGHRDNVLFVQGDIFNLPIKHGSVDFAYSIGVIHHTPNPQEGFNNMADLVKKDGKVGISLYDISLYKRPNLNSLKVSFIELMWSLNLFRCELFRQITTRIPRKMFLAYCKYFIPILHYINKVPVIRYIRYLFPSTCYRHLPVICSQVDTHDTYATKIVHQYRSKDIFQWFLQLGLTKIIVHNSRPGWVSITADKESEETRAMNTLVLKQPKSPGEPGYYN